jgi:hypothetical protein
MPHLHLPIDHTDADLVLAANLADIVGSEDLYVAWSYESGPGVIPEVEAILVEQRPPSSLAALAVALRTAFTTLMRALVGRPGPAAMQAAQAAGSARRTAEPSA